MGAPCSLLRCLYLGTQSAVQQVRWLCCSPSSMTDDRPWHHVNVVSVSAAAEASGDGRRCSRSGDPGRRGKDPVQVRSLKLSLMTSSPMCDGLCCHSRAEFLSLLKTYNYFLKDQTQLHLSYSHVRQLRNVVVL